MVNVPPMGVVDEIKTRARQAIAPILGTVVVGYFGYHMVQGDYGLIAYLHLKAKVAQAHAIEERLERDRSRLEKRVVLLRPDNLDRDLLEERARAMLNYAHPDDVVIFR